MNLSKLKITLTDAMQVEGDLIDFRIFQGSIFCHLVAAAVQNSRTAYGIDTFCGLPKPTKNDLSPLHYYPHKEGAMASNYDYTVKNMERLLKKNNTNYELIKGDIKTALAKIPETTLFSFALLDVLQYEPTSNALEFIWERMNYGGTIFIANYNEKEAYGADLAIKEFLEKNQDSVIYNHQLLVNGVKEQFLIVKCFNENRKPKNWLKFIPSKKPLTIALVLKTGGDVYNFNYVNALTNSIKKNTTIPHEIVCLTDNSTGFNSNIDRVIPLEYNFPKWWSKIELFKPNLFENRRVFYFDLDTVIVDNIDEILNFEIEFSGLRDFYHLHSLGSGLMAWNPEKTNNIFNEFIKNPYNIINSYPQGDQRWIDENKPSICYLQDTFSKQIVSYKKDCLHNRVLSIPSKAKIICFHGNPRPHTVTNPLIKAHWNP